MRWCVSVGVILVAGAIAGGDVSSAAAPNAQALVAVDKAKRVDV